MLFCWLAATLTAGIGTAVAQSVSDPLTIGIRDSLTRFFGRTARAADEAMTAVDFSAINSITRGEANLRNVDTGTSSIFDNPRDGCVVGGGRDVDGCIIAVAGEFEDLYRSGLLNIDDYPIFNAVLNAETGVPVSVDASDNTDGSVAIKVRPAVRRYYLSLPTPADDDDDDAPWAEAIGGAIVLSYFANYLIKQTTWQGNLFTYAMPTSDDTFAYGVQFEPNEDWHMRFSVADSSHAETPADPYYRMQVEYRF